jgi:predicted anti-sigma-YlaC factor YlaD
MTMNCFEARQDFPAMWRRKLAEERRTALTAHLKECAKCEQAFRTFALTAPVLHCDAEPPARRVVTRLQALGARRPPSVTRRRAPVRRWAAMCAVITIFVAAGLSAWLSVAAPIGDLSAAINNDSDEPAVQLLGQDLGLTSSDLAG